VRRRHQRRAAALRGTEADHLAAPNVHADDLVPLCPLAGQEAHREDPLRGSVGAFPADERRHGLVRQKAPFAESGADLGVVTYGLHGVLELFLARAQLQPRFAHLQ